MQSAEEHLKKQRERLAAKYDHLVAQAVALNDEIANIDKALAALKGSE